MESPLLHRTELYNLTIVRPVGASGWKQREEKIAEIVTAWEKKTGNFYDLETAYKDGLITKENLERIADYHDEYLDHSTNWTRPAKEE